MNTLRKTMTKKKWLALQKEKRSRAGQAMNTGTRVFGSKKDYNRAEEKLKILKGDY